MTDRARVRHAPSPLALVVRLAVAPLLVAANLAGHAGPAVARDEQAALEPPKVCVTPARPATGGETRGGAQRFPANAFIRTELFFGSPAGSSTGRFKRFLDAVVTPCFPDGLTLLTGSGQFRASPTSPIVQETSFVLILFYPRDAWEESNAKIEAIRALYKERFRQQAVLRVDDHHAVRVAF